jgi:hypothetical protein
MIRLTSQRKVIRTKMAQPERRKMYVVSVIHLIRSAGAQPLQEHLGYFLS